MSTAKLVASLLLTVTLGMTSLSNQKTRRKPAGDTELAKKIARFSPTVLTADLSQLSPGDRKALTKIIAAAKLLDPLFLRQVWSGNEALKQKLQADKSVAGKQRLHYFLINDGPWSRLDHNEPFIEGVPQKKPPYANYYPEDMTKAEFETWVASLSETEKQKATGFFHLIRRGADGTLTTVPYITGPTTTQLRHRRKAGTFSRHPAVSRTRMATDRFSYRASTKWMCWPTIWRHGFWCGAGRWPGMGCTSARLRS